MARIGRTSTLSRMEPITWLVIGLIAGWLAGLVMKGSGYGLVGLARVLPRRTVHA
jgi:hypothetical protein